VRKITGGEGAHVIIVVPGIQDAFAMAPHVGRNKGFIVCVRLSPNEVDLPILATLVAASGMIFLLPHFVLSA
jgi:propanol-preferring alcohol dehydrogenase